MIGESISEYGKGGMKTKIQAAKTAMLSGCHLAITNGSIMKPIRSLFEGRPCTWFEPNKSPMAARKQWIAGTMNPVGKIVIDQGAVDALKKGSSLLPAGVKMIEGSFERGDVIEVCSEDNKKIGIGLAGYSSTASKSIMGHKSDEIAGSELSSTSKSEVSVVDSSSSLSSTFTSGASTTNSTSPV